MTIATTFKLPRFFMWHIGRRDPDTGVDRPIIFIFDDKGGRDDAVHSATLSGHSVKAINWTEAFALVAPDKDGCRTFRDQAGWPQRLEPDWTPDKEYSYDEEE